MRNCECECHKEKGFLQKLINNFYLIFVSSIYVLVFSFLFAGTTASCILLIKMFPEYQYYLVPFMDLSSIAGQIALVSLGLLIISAAVFWIGKLFHRPKKTIEVFR